MKYFFILFFCLSLNSQYFDTNNEYINEKIHYEFLQGRINKNISLNLRPLKQGNLKNKALEVYKSIIKSKNELLDVKFLGVDYFSEYSSHHPYNRNNGSMIPNRGYQHIISPGLFLKIGPLSIKFKPEHHYSQNLEFDGFWEGHYSEIWAKRYRLWNHIDMPERFGKKRFNRLLLGQSSVRLNWKNISIGISNENLWWGPSRRNSIMMSNNAQGFKHITLNTNEAIKTPVGNFEWQFITGRLENSGFTPPNTEFEHAGTKLYVPKINQQGLTDDWRYLQGIIISYNPKLIPDLSIGFIRWVNMYSALVEGKYWWLNGKPSYFPVFKNLFRKNDPFENYEAQTDQAAGVFLKWFWRDSKAEIYGEFYHNDSKQNFRDLILDADHSRAVTIGLNKIFKINKSDFLFSWEWTQMEQNASRLIRNAGSWYEHAWVYDGYTNKGEVLGSSIGPGSNSHYFSLNRIVDNQKVGIAFEIIDNDNDFFHLAFADAKDFRRYWKDINFHLNYNILLGKLAISSKVLFSKSLNYQWELDDYAEPYYHPGRDVNNFHLNLKLTYFGN